MSDSSVSNNAAAKEKLVRYSCLSWLENYVQLSTYNKYFVFHKGFNVTDIYACRWRLQTGPFPVGLCRQIYNFHGSGRLCLLYFKCPDPVPVLLGPLVSFTVYTQNAQAYQPVDTGYEASHPFPRMISCTLQVIRLQADFSTRWGWRRGSREAEDL